MSINDPILEALSFTLESDLNILSSPGVATCSTSSVSRKNPSLSGAEVKKTDNDCARTYDETVIETRGASSGYVNSAVHLGEDHKTTCLFQECLFASAENICCDKKARGEFLAHLFTDHKLVIDRPEEIANLSKYLAYWSERFKSGPITDFCVGFALEEPPKPREDKKVKTSEANNSTTTATAKDNLYYMLCPDLPEDSKLRKDLWKKRLDLVLEVNRQEREELNFCRRCLFCREVITDNRSKYFIHMRESHNFHIGSPDNLVFVMELFQLIEDKLNRLECLSCEHVFKDKGVLKEHMRKKQHRKINPKNQEYDRFYVVNYLEPGKTWETLEFEDTEEEKKEDEWIEPMDDKDRNIVCLFCSVAESEFERILDHLKSDHYFDFTLITSNLDFYRKVKLVNYIRRNIYQNTCLVCEERFSERTLLLQHISDHRINGSFEMLPSAEHWDQPEYFFPTYESDDFLTFLDDSTPAGGTEPVSSSEDESNVIPEDLPLIGINQQFDLAGFAMRYHNQDHRI